MIQKFSPTHEYDAKRFIYDMMHRRIAIVPPETVFDKSILLDYVWEQAKLLDVDIAGIVITMGPNTLVRFTQDNNGFGYTTENY